MTGDCERSEPRVSLLDPTLQEANTALRCLKMVEFHARRLRGQRGKLGF